MKAQEKEFVAAIMGALEQSVRLQSHYATLLNQYDGGKRVPFPNAKAWLERIAVCQDPNNAAAEMTKAQNDPLTFGPMFTEDELRSLHDAAVFALDHVDEDADVPDFVLQSLRGSIEKIEDTISPPDCETCPKREECEAERERRACDKGLN